MPPTTHARWLSLLTPALLSAVACTGADLAQPLEVNAPTSTADGALSVGCEDIDPAKELGAEWNDIEVTIDPDDAASNALMVSGTGSRVVVVRLDAKTGLYRPGEKRVVARNFTGNWSTNGAEFAQQPTGSPASLGLLYAGPEGVHGIWRSGAPGTPWDAFQLDAKGSRTLGEPKALAGTSPGSYPNASPPFGLTTYGSFLGACTFLQICFGPLVGAGAKMTDPGKLPGLAVVASSLHPRSDGVFVVHAKDTSTGWYGIYEVRTDGAGGPKRITPTLGIEDLYVLDTLRGAVFPSTTTAVFFSASKQNGKPFIDAWQQPTAGGAAAWIGRVEAAAGHFRIGASRTQLVLHYQTPGSGAFSLPLDRVDGKFQLGVPKRTSTDPTGTEILYLPAADRWASYGKTASGTGMDRCWLTQPGEPM